MDRVTKWICNGKYSYGKIYSMICRKCISARSTQMDNEIVKGAGLVKLMIASVELRLSMVL